MRYFEKLSEEMTLEEKADQKYAIAKSYERDGRPRKAEEYKNKASRAYKRAYEKDAESISHEDWVKKEWSGKKDQGSLYSLIHKTWPLGGFLTATHKQTGDRRHIYTFVGDAKNKKDVRQFSHMYGYLTKLHKDKKGIPQKYNFVVSKEMGPLFKKQQLKKEAGILKEKIFSIFGKKIKPVKAGYDAMAVEMKKLNARIPKPVYNSQAFNEMNALKGTKTTNIFGEVK